MNKKKIVIGIIVVILVIALMSLGMWYMSNNEENNSQALNNRVNTSSVVNSNNTSNTTLENETEEQKILVAYFSLPETNDPNNMNEDEENSTVIVNGEVLGNTQYIAQLISENVGADIFRIEAKEDYPLKHDALVDRALEEQNEDARPEIKETVDNMDDYDIVFIGYPNWWGDMPMIIYTFLEQYNFDGKTIIPFNTHGGSGLSNTVTTITEKLPNSNVISNAFTLSRNRIESAPKEVESWLEEIGL